MLFNKVCVLFGLIYFFVYSGLNLLQGFFCICSTELEIYGDMIGNLVPELQQFVRVICGC